MADTFTGDANLLRNVISRSFETEWMPATETGAVDRRYYDEWTNPDNALIDNTATAYASQSGTDDYNWESYYKFGFAIPTDAEILGIQIRYRHYESSADSLDGGLSLNIVKPDTSSQQKESALSTTVATSTLGSASDPYSFPSITPTEINSDQFTVDIGVYSYTGKIITANLEYLEVKITYTRDLWFSGDASFLSVLSEQFTGNSNLIGEESIQFTGDASLSKNIDDQFTGDASLLSVLSGSFTGDSNLYGEETGVFTSDANLLRTDISETFDGDASLLEVTSGSFTGDASLLAIESEQFTGDASLVVTSSDNFTGDSNLTKVNISEQFTGDAALLSLEEATFTGDASIQKVNTETYTSDAQLIAMDTATIAGTCDCISAATLGWGLSGMDEFGIELGI